MSTHVLELEKTSTFYIMAAIDRVVHHSVILDMMDAESYRALEATHRQEQLEAEPLSV